MSLESDIAILAEIPLLSGLSPDQLRLLAFGAEHRRLRAGEILFREGARADAGFVVVQGRVVLSTGRPGHEKEVVRAGPGMLLGEIALLTDTRRPATATAETDCDAIRITRSLFRRMLEEYPEIAFALHGKLTEDLARMTDDILALEDRFGDPS